MEPTGGIMNTVKISIAAPLKKFTDGRDDICFVAASVGEALQALCARFPGLDGRILGPEGTLREFINVFVGKKNIRSLDGLRTAVDNGDVIAIASPFSGG
jgi:molybdopterin converting factor small subunit